MIRYIVTSVWILLAMWLQAQPQLSVDRTKVVIGDQVQVTLIVPVSPGQQWINRKTFWPDTISSMEITGEPACRDEKEQTICTWKVSLFDTGWVRIPSLAVILQSGDRTDTVRTLDIPIEVAGVEPDSTGLIGIQDIYAEPFQLSYYLRYIPYVVAAAAIVALLFWWSKRRKKPEVEVIPVHEPLPHEWALAELELLTQQRLWQSGDIKEHYSRLTGIFRGYLEKRYEIRALEQTSDEISRQLTALEMNTEVQQHVIELLSMADMVKFAKADPGIDIHSRATDRVRDFVLATIPVTSSTAHGTDMA